MILNTPSYKNFQPQKIYLFLAYFDASVKFFSH